MQEYELIIDDFTFEYSNYNYNVSYKDECICSEFVPSAFPSMKEFEEYSKSLYIKLKNKYQ